MWVIAVVCADHIRIQNSSEGSKHETSVHAEFLGVGLEGLDAPNRPLLYAPES